MDCDPNRIAVTKPWGADSEAKIVLMGCNVENRLGQRETNFRQAGFHQRPVGIPVVKQLRARDVSPFFDLDLGPRIGAYPGEVSVDTVVDHAHQVSDRLANCPLGTMGDSLFPSISIKGGQQSTDPLSNSPVGATNIDAGDPYCGGINLQGTTVN